MELDPAHIGATPHLVLASGSTALPAELIKAYLNTAYHVFGSGSTPGWTLQVAHTSPHLQAYMQRCQVQSAAYITAYNPLGQLLSQEENKGRNNSLRAELDRLGLHYLEGEGQGLDTTWPAEASFLIMGTDLAASNRLATQFDQNAYVWCPIQATPQLVLLR